MGAPKGNKNAEIWTEAKAVELFEKALELCKEKSYYAVHGVKIEGYSFDFIGEIACELDTFHENITAHLPDRFEHLKSKAKRIKTYMERNCYSNTKKGIIREATGIVNLKSNHKWTDRNDHSSQDGTMTPKTNVIVQDQKTADNINKLMNEDD